MANPIQVTLKSLTAEQYTSTNRHPQGACDCSDGIPSVGGVMQTSMDDRRIHVHTYTGDIVYLDYSDWVIQVGYDKYMYLTDSDFEILFDRTRNITDIVRDAVTSSMIGGKDG